MPLAEIRENLEKLRRETETRRNCSHCPQRTACSRCLFPCPLAEEEFCHLNATAHLEKAAELMRIFDMIKEINGGTAIYHADSL